MRWQEDTALRHQRKIETNLSRRLRPVGLGRLIFLPLTRRCFYDQLVVKEYGDPRPELVLEVSFARPELVLEVRFSPSLAHPELVLKVLFSPQCLPGGGVKSLWDSLQKTVGPFNKSWCE